MEHMFVVIEGIDGSGKGTQAALLAARAAASGLTTQAFSFPRYEKNPFGIAIGKYLNGAFGDVRRLPAHLIALLFAGDRFTVRDELVEAIRTKSLVICDRYEASNLAHQAAKLLPEEWPEFFDWVAAVEFGIFRMPRPDVTIYLDMPVATARTLIAHKQQRVYTPLKEDMHEKDESYLESCARVYRHLIDHDIAGPWCAISCATPNGTPLAQEQVSAFLWSALTDRGLGTAADAAGR
jgi:dTMP kinase